MERLIERGLFASRWMMAPMYLGLALALVILVWIFLMELWRFVLVVPVMTVNDAILGVLALIDLSLAANLLLIVIFSGYENFVSRMDLTDHEDRPHLAGRGRFLDPQTEAGSLNRGNLGYPSAEGFHGCWQICSRADPLDDHHPSGLRDLGRVTGDYGLDRQSC